MKSNQIDIRIKNPQDKEGYLFISTNITLCWEKLMTKTLLNLIIK